MDVLLLADGRVVGGGYYGIAVAGVGIFVRAGPHRAATYKTSVVVRGCNGDHDAVNWPNGRPPLPPGNYQAVAVIDDHTSTPAGGGGQIVSSPVSVTVRR